MKLIFKFEGMIDYVMGVEVVKGFLPIEYLKYFQPYANDKNDKNFFQREIDKRHEDKIIKFLDDESRPDKIMPDIIFSLPENINESDINFRRIEPKHQNNRIEISFYDEEFCKKVKVIDGNHRLSAILKSEWLKKSSLQRSFKEKVSVTFIINNPEQSEKAFFYYLNAKSKKLLPTNYLNLITNTENKDLKKIDMELVYFKFIFELLKDNLLNDKFKNLSLSKQSKIRDKSIELSDYYMKKFDNKLNENRFLKVRLLKKINQLFINKSLNVKFNLLKLAFYILATKNYDLKIILKEIEDFNIFLNSYGLNDNYLNDLNEFETIYKIYKATYIPKSKRIFISMPFHKETEWTFFLVKDIVNEVEKEMQKDDRDFKLEVVRVDEYIDGVSKSIPVKVFEEIEKSGLMIADLTGNNKNVYNEVGYKMGLDRANGIKEPQIIFILNSASYYNEDIKNRVECVDENSEKYEVKLKENKTENIKFNLYPISQIRFKDSKYLRAELKNQLFQYYRSYKIMKYV